MSIEDKLRGCLQEYDKDGNSNYGKAIAAIKQASEDEGYISFKSEYKAKGFMTGQEWYDRFAERLANVDYRGNSGYSQADVLEAAKRASGLK